MNFAAKTEDTMNIKNCRVCGRIYNYVSGPNTCPACRESLEAKFQEVKEYIREHKGAGIAQVAEACEVDAAQIRQWLREDRLEVTEDSPLYLTCETCGAPIRSGRFCEKCKNSVTRDLNDVLKAGRPQQPTLQKKNKEDGAKMRFLK